MISAEYDGKLTETDWDLAPKIIDDTLRAEAREHLWIRKLQSVVFSSSEKLLDAGQWLIEVANFIRTVRIPDEDWVEVSKIHLKDVARIWWLVEEAKLEKLITWDQFSKSFYEEFFSDGIKKDERII